MDERHTTREGTTLMPRLVRSALLVLSVVVGVVGVVGVVDLLRRSAQRVPALRSVVTPHENGAVFDVVVREHHARCALPAASAIAFAAGPDHDPPGRSGLAAVARRVFERKLRAAAQDARLVVHGEPATASTVVSTLGTPRDVKADLAAIARSISNSTVLEPELAEALAATNADITRRRGSDATLAAETWALESIAPSPGRGFRGGIADEIRDLSTSEVETFLRTLSSPRGAVVVLLTDDDEGVGGDVDAPRALSELVFPQRTLTANTTPSLRPAGETFVHGTLVMGDAPRALALAVPAPARASTLHPAFTMLAARVVHGAATHGLSSRFDPLGETALVVTAALQPGEAPEDGARRIRAVVEQAIAPALAPEDRARALALNADIAGLGEGCPTDPRGFVVSRARRRLLQLDVDEWSRLLEATTEIQGAQARSLFGTEHTVVVAAGGVLR
jgi:hypothetical protein